MQFVTSKKWSLETHINGVHTHMIGYKCTRCSLTGFYLSSLQRHITTCKDATTKGEMEIFLNPDPIRQIPLDKIDPGLLPKKQRKKLLVTLLGQKEEKGKLKPNKDRTMRKKSCTDSIHPDRIGSIVKNKSPSHSLSALNQSMATKTQKPVESEVIESDFSAPRTEANKESTVGNTIDPPIIALKVSIPIARVSAHIKEKEGMRLKEQRVDAGSHVIDTKSDKNVQVQMGTNTETSIGEEYIQYMHKKVRMAPLRPKVGLIPLTNEEIERHELLAHNPNMTPKRTLSSSSSNVSVVAPFVDDNPNEEDTTAENASKAIDLSKKNPENLNRVSVIIDKAILPVNEEPKTVLEGGEQQLKEPERARESVYAKKGVKPMSPLKETNIPKGPTSMCVQLTSMDIDQSIRSSFSEIEKTKEKEPRTSTSSSSSSSSRTTHSSSRSRTSRTSSSTSSTSDTSSNTSVKINPMADNETINSENSTIKPGKYNLIFIYLWSIFLLFSCGGFMISLICSFSLTFISSQYQ